MFLEYLMVHLKYIISKLLIYKKCVTFINKKIRYCGNGNEQISLPLFPSFTFKNLRPTDFYLDL